MLQCFNVERSEIPQMRGFNALMLGKNMRRLFVFFNQYSGLSVSTT